MSAEYAVPEKSSFGLLVADQCVRVVSLKGFPDVPMIVQATEARHAF